MLCIRALLVYVVTMQKSYNSRGGPFSCCYLAIPGGGFLIDLFSPFVARACCCACESRPWFSRVCGPICTRSLTCPACGRGDSFMVVVRRGVATSPYVWPAIPRYPDTPLRGSSGTALAQRGVATTTYVSSAIPRSPSLLLRGCSGPAVVRRGVATGTHVWAAIPRYPGPPLRGQSGLDPARTGVQTRMIQCGAPGRHLSPDDPVQGAVAPAARSSSDDPVRGISSPFTGSRCSFVLTAPSCFAPDDPASLHHHGLLLLAASLLLHGHFLLAVAPHHHRLVHLSPSLHHHGPVLIIVSLDNLGLVLINASLHHHGLVLMALSLHHHSIIHRSPSLLHHNPVLINATEAVPRTPWPGYGIQPVSGPLTPCTACSVP